jgi:Rrf2 family protein
LVGYKGIMLKISKKVDYGLMALMHLAQHPERPACSAREIAETYRIPTELMAKILQRLARKGLLTSLQGISGGYALAQPAGAISAAAVIEAIEGRLSMTSCVSGDNICVQFERCNVKSPLQRLHEGVIEMLGQLTIEQMAQQWPIRFRLPFSSDRSAFPGQEPLKTELTMVPALPVFQDV